MENKKRIAAGDKHYGKQVEIIYDNSDVYVFKPRSAETEFAFEAFLLKLQQESFPFIPECEKIIDSGRDWHKAEFIRQENAESKENIKEFFNRCGTLIFILYILGTTDIHSENLIARKNSPVLVDIETLLSAKAESGRASSFASLADSVMKSHLLPNWIKIGDKNYDCSGLCGRYPEKKNILVFEGKELDPFDYCDFIAEGFEKAYEFALNNREFLCESVDIFSDCYFRFILRPTAVYDKIIDNINTAEKEKRRTFAENLLSRAYKNDIRKNRFEEMKAVFDSEVDSVMRSDIPVFLSKGSSEDLFDSEKNPVKKNFFVSSPVSSAKSRISALSQEDCITQLKIIRQSISASVPSSRKIRVEKTDDVFKEITDELENNSVNIFSDWIMLDQDRSGCLFLRNSGFGLYDGMMGILCCYAAIYNKTGYRKYADLIEKHYDNFRKVFLNDNIEFSLSGNNYSLQSGGAGFISALLHIAELTQQNSYRTDAAFLAEKITGTADGISLDVMNGLAGIALTLPKLPKETGKKIAGKILPFLAEYVPERTGVAHGAAGIALALAKAQSVIDIDSYDEKILRLLDFETGFYDEEKKNWKVNDSGFMYGWCSGAPGMIMARSELMKFTKNPGIIKICRSDIMTAADFISERETKKDCLCCGSASKLMALSRLGMDGNKVFGELKNRYMKDELRLFSFNNACDVKSGLMQGLAGIGYALAMNNNPKSGDMLI